MMINIDKKEWDEWRQATLCEDGVTDLKDKKEIAAYFRETASHDGQAARKLKEEEALGRWLWIKKGEAVRAVQMQVLWAAASCWSSPSQAVSAKRGCPDPCRWEVLSRVQQREE
jgi:hypothetical protein